MRRIKIINFFKKHYSMLIIGASILAAGFAFGYMTSSALSVKAPPAESGGEGVFNGGAATDSPGAGNTVSAGESADNSEVIDKSANFVYDYIYSDGVTVSETAGAPAFVVGENENELKSSIDGWEIASFSADEIVLQKTFDEKSGQNYVVGIYNGYIAVYYEAEDGGKPLLKEITDMRVDALSANETAKLEQGIPVTGNDALFKLLQDYGS